MLSTMLVFFLSIGMPVKFTKAFQYQGERTSIHLKDKGVEIYGSWSGGKPPGVRLETDETIMPKDIGNLNGFVLIIQGDGKTYKIRAIVTDKAGFLDKVTLHVKTDRKVQKLYFPFDKRSPLVVSIPVATEGYPLILLIEPEEKGSFNLNVLGLEWKR